MTRLGEMRDVNREFMDAWRRNKKLSFADLVKILSLHTDDTDTQFLVAVKKFNELEGRL